MKSVFNFLSLIFDSVFRFHFCFRFRFRDSVSGFRIPCFSAAACFLCRMEFSAEQLAKWVAESTDVHVGSFYVIFFRLFALEMLVLFDCF